MIAAGSGRFAPLVSRPLELENVVVTFSEDRPPLPESVQKDVDLVWTREGGAGGRGLFDGRLAGLNRWEYRNGTLRLHLVPVRYRELWFVHVGAGVRDVPPPGVLPRALGISVAVLQGEEVVLMLRSDSVGEWPGKLDVFGGHIDWPEAVAPVDPAEAARAELREELGTAGQRAELGSCLGLAEVVRTRKPEIVFLARIPETVPVSLAETNEEVERIIRLPLAHLRTQLQEGWEQLTPSAEASLWLLVSALDV